MAIKPKCDFCNCELNEFGAILLSPPNKHNLVKKLHLCVSCYKKILKLLKQSKL
jgi:hypothetical protein